jgi:hypothetical protein
MKNLTTVQLLSSRAFPNGLDEWLVNFLEEAERETVLLRENGASAQATARDALIRGLLRRAAEYLDEEVSVAEAASMLDRGEETVRRAVRDGRLPDQRRKGRARHRLKRGDVISLAGGARKRYDPVADAQDIAKLRKSA